MSKGKSNGIESTNVGKGQKIVRAFPLDRSSYDLPNARNGGSFGGSDTNLSHSLQGVSANQKGK